MVAKGKGVRAKQRFSRANKLLTSHAFSNVFNSGCTIRCDQFTVTSKPNRVVTPRLGIIVRKKVVARAVDRNFLKRQIREAFRLHQSVLKGLDIVVKVKKSFSKSERVHIKAQLVQKMQSVPQCHE